VEKKKGGKGRALYKSWLSQNPRELTSKGGGGGGGRCVFVLGQSCTTRLSHSTMSRGREKVGKERRGGGEGGGKGKPVARSCLMFNPLVSSTRY